MLDLPEIKDISSETLKLGTKLDARLPSMPSGELNDLSFTNHRQEAAAELMEGIRQSYEVTRRQSRRSKAKAKARNRQAQKQAERR